MELLGDISRGQRDSVSSKDHEPHRGSTSFVEAFPKPVMEGATKDEDEEIRAALKNAGAKVELKSYDTPQEEHEDQVWEAGPEYNPTPVGAPSGATASRTVTRELIMAVAAELGSMDRTWYAPDIPADKANNARKSMKIPADELMLVLFDDTIYGSAKNGVLIGVTGLYYKTFLNSNNPFANRREYASWEAFLANPFEVYKDLPGNVVLKVANRRWLVATDTGSRASAFLMKLRAKALDGL
jgi:hypothetical protein